MVDEFLKKTGFRFGRSESTAEGHVTGIKMTHEYLLRAFLTFTVGAWGVEEITKLMGTPAPAPLIMCCS